MEWFFIFLLRSFVLGEDGFELTEKYFSTIVIKRQALFVFCINFFPRHISAISKNAALEYNGLGGIYMDFLVVSDSKLKIMMSRDDMLEYDIDGDDIDYDDPKTRKTFWKILDVARERCGFEVSGDKVLIQFYPSKDGSEIFVTKLGIISANAERTISSSGKVAMLEAQMAIYKFDSLSSVSEAARIIEKEGGSHYPRAFFDERGIYYIITEERVTKKKKELSRVAEFGERIPDNLAAYIAEHSDEISFELLCRL